MEECRIRCPKCGAKPDDTAVEEHVEEETRKYETKAVLPSLVPLSVMFLNTVVLDSSQEIVNCNVYLPVT